MGFHFPRIVRAKQIIQQVLSTPVATDVPKGHFAVYVGETEKKRIVVPISYLNHPSFQNLICQAEEEFEFDHPMGGRTIPCREETFIVLQKEIYPYNQMGIRMPRIIHTKKILRWPSLMANQAASTATDVPNGYFPVYVGESEKKRFVIPVSYLNQPSFQDLLTKAEEEYGFDHPMGGLTIPCREDIFIDLTSRLNDL
ncbi:hypothetical protein F0562_020492 [Nyssa sinensis]|uniref:Uncharacterized protein n=1 Tax=Nyssa sinensis TaxID=561372 RepID=A0A5J5BWK6_9ASTE|nr:hypothetical protein F0562_020492 [Nyssa sinensis]